MAPGKFGGSAGAFIEAQRDVTKHYDDATGRMRVARAIHGNLLKAGAGIKLSAGLGAELASKTAASDAVDLSLAAVQPYSIRSYERNAVQATKGVDLVMQLASLETAEASHIDNRLDAAAQRPARPRPTPESAPNPTLSRTGSDEFFEAQDFLDPEPKSEPLDGEDKTLSHTDTDDEFFDALDHLEPEHDRG